MKTMVSTLKCSHVKAAELRVSPAHTERPECVVCAPAHWPQACTLAWALGWSCQACLAQLPPASRRSERIRSCSILFTCTKSTIAWGLLSCKVENGSLSFSRWGARREPRHPCSRSACVGTGQGALTPEVVRQGPWKLLPSPSWLPL